MKKIKPKDGKYYDLIRIPHGHIPSPKANFWSCLPMPVMEYRDYNFYYCPVCGAPSFFKIRFACYTCQEEMQYEGTDEWAYRRYKRKQRNDYFREILKRLEYLCLPFLIVLRKAWYVESVRKHWRDYGNVRRTL